MSDSVNDVVVDAVVEQVVAAAAKKGRGRPRKYNYPSTLTCTKTGKITKTNPTQFGKALVSSGMSQEEYIATYVCRGARDKKPRKARVPKVAAVEPVVETVSDVVETV